MHNWQLLKVNNYRETLIKQNEVQLSAEEEDSPGANRESVCLSLLIQTNTLNPLHHPHAQSVHNVHLVLSSVHPVCVIPITIRTRQGVAKCESSQPDPTMINVQTWGYDYGAHQTEHLYTNTNTYI